MNQAASVPGSNLTPDATDVFTAGHLLLVALFALLVIAGLIWGRRNAQRRREGEREIAAHNQAVKQEAKAPPPDDDPPPPVDREKARAPTELILDPVKASAPTELLLPAAAAGPAALAKAPARPAAPATAPVAGPKPADGPVTQLKGLGPKLATKLAEHGITTVGHLAALTDDEAVALDARLGPFTGRMGRDRWQEQARFLAAGDTAGFEAVFGRL